MVLVSKAEKRAIFLYLLKEGVIVVRKDAYLPEHQSVTGVSNLKVMMIVKSLKSQGILSEVFNWQWSYYAVTDKGVAFLAKALAVSSEVVPATMKKRVVTVTKPKVDDDGEKAGAAAEGETPGAGRGQR
jgi:small subunit ribosomal protein S10e